MPVADHLSQAYVARELPPEEWHRLRDIPPYHSSGLPAANGNWVMIVIESHAGEIVAASAVHTQVHWDPWWVRDDFQGNPGVMRALIREGVAALRGRQVDHAFCTIDDADAYTAGAARKLGFLPAPGRLYLVDIEEVERY